VAGWREGDPIAAAAPWVCGDGGNVAVTAERGRDRVSLGTLPPGGGCGNVDCGGADGEGDDASDSRAVADCEGSPAVEARGSASPPCLAPPTV